MGEGFSKVTRRSRVLVLDPETKGGRPLRTGKPGVSVSGGAGTTVESNYLLRRVLFFSSALHGHDVWLRYCPSFETRTMSSTGLSLEGQSL